MPRIRTIKPEFFRSPDTASATPVARLLYIAMWCWADDSGRGEADLKALEGFAFPNDDVHELSGGTSENFRHVLTEVVETFGVVLYIADGRPYYLIPSWGEHQRNERSAKPKYPGPDDGVTCTVEEIGGSRRKFRRTVAEAPRSSGPGTGEQGNRGTGEQCVPLPDEPPDEEAPEHIETHTRPTTSRPTPTELTFIRAHIGMKAPKSVEQGLVLEVRKLQNHYDRAVIEEALKAWSTRDGHPKLLPHLVSDVLKRANRPQAQSKGDIWDTSVIQPARAAADQQRELPA